jgi:small subunit ribosomal protein S17
MVRTKKTETEKKSGETILAAPIISTHGRTFEGIVTKKFPKRIVIEFERTVFMPKYERFYKKKTRLHARLLDSMAADINVGDRVRIKECRPLSKIIHFIVDKKINADNSMESKK